MEFITGGAYQGKTEYAKARFGLKDKDIFTCGDDGEINFSAPCIDGLEAYALYCARKGVDPVAAFRQNRQKWQNAVLICRDVFCGVVPTDASIRAGRECAGRLCAYLANEAESVTRLFCSLPQKLK